MSFLQKKQLIFPILQLIISIFLAPTVFAADTDGDGLDDTVDNEINTTIETPTVTYPTEDQIYNSGKITFSGTAEANTEVDVELSGSTICTDQAVNGSGSWTCGTTVSPDGAYTLIITAGYNGNNSTIVSSTRNFTLDTTAPELSETVVVTNPTSDTTPEYIFNSTEAGTITYGSDCTSTTYTTASAGDNTITFDTLAPDTYSDCTITVTDSAGNTSDTLEINTFEIDTTPPVISEITAITSPTNNDTPTYIFETDQTGTITYGGDCSSDTTAAASGSTTAITLNTLADGTYTNCTIIVTDTSGNQSNTLEIADFTIDTAAPALTTVTISSDNSTSTLAKVDDTITVNFTAAGAITNITSTILGQTATITDLGSNSYTSTITAETGRTEGTVTFTIDYEELSPTNTATTVTAVTDSSSVTFDETGPTLTEITPVTSTLTGIANITNDSSPEYTFNSTEGMGTFSSSCIDGSTFQFYTTGEQTITLNTLADNTYNGCYVFGYDRAGNISNTLTLSSFEIDTIKPSLKEITPITTPTNDTTPDYTFTTSEDISEILYFSDCSSTSTSLDSGENTITLEELSEGTYSDCDFIAVDKAGNLSTALDITSFEIDTTPPEISETTAIDTFTNDNTPTYTFTTDETGTIAYYGECTSSTTTASSTGTQTIIFDNPLSDGLHSNCEITVTDDANNTSTALEVTDFTVDTTAPVFNNIAVTSNNAFNASYAKPDDTLTFTLALSNTDTSGGGTITFDIGTTTGLTATIAATDTAAINHTATYTIDSNENGAISVTDISFTDNVAYSITGFSSTTPTPTVIIDTTSPTHDSTAVVSSGNSDTSISWAKAGEGVIYTLNFSEAVTVTVNSSSTANNITTLVNEINESIKAPGSTGTTSGTIIFQAVSSDNGVVTPSNIDFSFFDAAGNQLDITSLGTITGDPVQTDTTPPTLPTVTIASNNTDPTWAKTNETITVTFTSDEIIRNQTGTILTETSTLTDTSGATNWTSALFTNGDETEGDVPFTLDFEDRAGNAGTQVTTTTDSSAVEFDRTDPYVSVVSIASSNTLYTDDAPTYYAKEDDTITLTFSTDRAIKDPVGTLFGKTPTISSSSDKKDWTLTVTTEATDTEGTVPFNLEIYDLAGNDDLTLTLTSTTDGSTIIYDRTNPTPPTTTTDKLGAETTDFKHRFNATYTFSGQNDLQSNGVSAGSGIWKYDTRFYNPDNGGTDSGINASETVLFTNNSYTPSSTIAPDDDPYELYVNITDKAGNQSGETLLYSQYYTIGISGTVTDQNGNPLNKVIVQVVARYNDNCDTGIEVCSATTDSDGGYSIILQKDRSYNVSFFNPTYYMQKTEITVAQDDAEESPSLQQITSPRQRQTSDQTIIIQTSQTQDAGTKTVATEISVNSLSGQVTITQSGSDIIVTSLSRITNISTNNTDVSITDNGDNTYTITGAGSAISSYSEGKTEGFTPRQEFTNNGQTSSFTSGTSRIGIENIPGNGKALFTPRGIQRSDKFTSGKFWTEEESKAHRDKANKPIPSKIATYENINGFELFSDYISGKLGLTKVKAAAESKRQATTKRFQIARKNIIIKKEEPKTSLTTFSEGLEKVEKKPTGLVTKKTEAAYHAVNKRLHDKQKKKDIFARKRDTSSIAPSRIKHKSVDTVQLRIGGKGISMKNFFKNQYDPGPKIAKGIRGKRLISKKQTINN